MKRLAATEWARDSGTPRDGPPAACACHFRDVRVRGLAYSSRSPTLPRPSAIHLRPDPAARLRLFCLPHAGGGASVFHPWSRILPREIQVCPIQLPGRENRLRERPATDLTVLVRQLADAVAPYLDLPFAIFGHSMGTALGFELARELRRRGLATPRHLVMSGGRAPHLRPTLPPLAALADPMFMEAVQERYGRFADEGPPGAGLLARIVPIPRAEAGLTGAYF